MNFDNFIESQPGVVKLLNNTVNKNRLVHTYLFEGAKGTNKLDAAYYLSSLIFCTGENKPCGSCDNCVKVINKVHPNIFYIEPIGDIIKKEQIIQLEHEFSMTPLGEKRRVFIINGIDKCNTQSANSLLKFLEEAKEDCYGILITENINNVLPTIVSRSQVVNFKMLANDILCKRLIDDGIDPLVSGVVSRIVNNVNDSKQMISEGNIIDIINGAIKVGEKIITDDNPYLEYIDCIQAMVKEKKENSSMFLNVLIMYINDVMTFAMNNKDNLLFKESIAKVEEYIGEDYLEYVKYLEILLKHKERIRYNINIELMFAQLFVELGGING